MSLYPATGSRAGFSGLGKWPRWQHI